jgi:alpha-glucosidase
MTQRGSVCIYEGEELGLTETELQFEDLQDPYGIEFWPQFKGRDGCRTPMVWDGGHKMGGFSVAEKTWLPIPNEHKHRAVSVQFGDQNSVLEHYRRFLNFRKQHLAFAKGEIEFLPVQGEVLSYIRRSGNEAILCIFNMSEANASVMLPDGQWEDLEGHGFSSTIEGQTINLPAWGAYFARQH